MLHGIDKALELAGWAFALMLAIMMFIGPQVIAEDKPAEESGEAAGAAPYAEQGSGDDGGGAAADGEAVFSDSCGSCHTFSAAGTSASVGPNLDDTSLDAAAIETVVRDGRGTMPGFGGRPVRGRDRGGGRVRRRELGRTGRHPAPSVDLIGLRPTNSTLAGVRGGLGTGRGPGHPAQHLVDAGEAAEEAVARGPQVDAPDTHALGAAEANRVIESSVEAPGPV